MVHHHIHINGDAFLWCIQLNGRCASCKREHRRPNKKVRLINPPEQLLTLADLVNLSHWIGTFIDHH